MSQFRIHHYSLLCKNHVNMLAVPVPEMCSQIFG